jgi:TATA-box binding protein (TBP) (component of TFIID and TFIIIB)
MSEVRNIVATGSFGCKISLQQLSHEDLMIEYDPHKFSGLLIRRLQPFKSHCQLYCNGKFTINGARTENQATRLAETYCRMLRKVGYGSAAVKDFKIVNMVACIDFKKKLNLEALVVAAPWSHFEPELFPGLSVRLSDATCVIFRTGKCNILGAKSVSDIQSTVLELEVLFDLKTVT